MLFGIFEYIEVDGAAQAAAVDPLAKIAAAFPEGEAYNVALPMGEARISSVMHLPRSGDGQWLINFNGTQFSVPIENLVWNGDTCQANLSLKFGQMGGDVVLGATVYPDGRLDGRLTSDGNTPFLIPRIEGERFVQE
jgi:hypothetical protein